MLFTPKPVVRPAKNARFVVVSMAVAVIAGLSACGSPYALKTTDIDYDSKQIGGSIEFTDPKPYRREALINERRDETKYLNDLMRDSISVLFEPEINRDLESLTTFSGQFAAKADPLAELSYNRAVATSDVQQEIATLRYQLELAELKHEVETKVSAMAAQTTAPETQPGTPTTTVTAPTFSVSPEAATDLLDKIATARGVLTGRLDADSKGPHKTTGVQSPIDTFLDRQAYRSLINTARNSASLDELHDYQGSALYRLNLDATVLPPPKAYNRTYGALRMEVAPPVFDRDAQEKLYLDWLTNLNRSLNEPIGDTGTFQESAVLAPLANDGDLFELAYFFYDPKGQTACVGATFDPTEEKTPGCARLTFAVSRPSIFNASDRSYSVYRIVKDASAMSIPTANGKPDSAFNLALARFSYVSDGACNDFAGALPVYLSPGQSGMTLRDTVRAAVFWQAISDRLLSVETQAREVLRHNHLPDPPRSAILRSDSTTVSVRLLYNAWQTARAASHCPSRTETAFLPERFRHAIDTSTARTAIYSVNPRHQSQHIGTTARKADALSLAAAVAATAPSSGLGANASLGLSRSATGKADAMERVPLVVSFAEAAEGETGAGKAPAFGWLMGPSVVMDAKAGSLVLEHQTASYNLSVDLSVPGWWPSLNLKTQTAWAPDWHGKDGRTMIFNPIDTKTIPVILTRNASDFDALTGVIMGNADVRIPSISSVSPKTLSACAATMQVRITGVNLWRATTVIIGGRKFDGDQVSVLPDMAGLLVGVTKETYSAHGDKMVEIAVLTPYGVATYNIPVDDLKSDGGCQETKPVEAQARVATAPSISSITPATASICYASPAFIVSGKNLKDVTGASLGPATGRGKAVGTEGDQVSVSFSNIPMKQMFAGIATSTLTIQTKQGLATTPVTIAAATC